MATADLTSNMDEMPAYATRQKQHQIQNQIKDDSDEANRLMQFLHQQHPEMTESLAAHLKTIGARPCTSEPSSQKQLVDAVTDKFRELQVCNDRARKAAEALYYWETKGAELAAEINIILGVDDSQRRA
ncbi:hypothetical protein F66182_9738 [Fusarium sp. NRRL 66182]|nr:hypothetical protein F66182_9738 [Fusarium sp. NRRL 66182]